MKLLLMACVIFPLFGQPQFTPLEKRLIQRNVDLENQLATQRKWRRDAEEKLKSTPVVGVAKIAALQKDAMAAHVADVKDAKVASLDTKATADKILESAKATEATAKATEAKAQHIETVVEDFSLQKTLAVNLPSIITLLLAAVAAIVSVSNNRINRRTDAKVVQIGITTQAVQKASNGHLTALMAARTAALRGTATALRTTVKALLECQDTAGPLMKAAWKAASDAEAAADAAEEELRLHLEVTERVKDA